ncbi:hypothetical protein [Bradyrhizobium liaoningense]
MDLGKQFDVERQRQHGPRALAEHGSRDIVGIDVEVVAFRQDVADHRIDQAEQRLMFQFLIAESNQCLERHLITEPMIVAQLDTFAFMKRSTSPNMLA